MIVVEEAEELFTPHLVYSSRFWFRYLILTTRCLSSNRDVSVKVKANVYPTLIRMQGDYGATVSHCHQLSGHESHLDVYKSKKVKASGHARPQPRLLQPKPRYPQGHCNTGERLSIKATAFRVPGRAFEDIDGPSPES